MKRAYIGITDFTTRSETQAMLEVFKKFRHPFSNRGMMVGVMMSYKTLHGLPSKWTDAFAKPFDIKDIFINDEAAYNTLHYADYEGINIFDSLMRAREFGTPNIHALQLDMIWPDPKILQTFRSFEPQTEIVIQANKNALEIVNNNPVLLRKKLEEYGDSIEYVLLDKSMGQGLGMKDEILRPFVDELVNHLPELGVAVAGGLGPNSMELVSKLAEDFPMISIDAQGQLRPSGSALDPIDWNMAAVYLEKALSILP